MLGLYCIHIRAMSLPVQEVTKLYELKSSQSKKSTVYPPTLFAPLHLYQSIICIFFPTTFCSFTYLFQVAIKIHIIDIKASESIILNNGVCVCVTLHGESGSPFAVHQNSNVPVLLSFLATVSFFTFCILHLFALYY